MQFCSPSVECFLLAVGNNSNYTQLMLHVTVKSLPIRDDTDRPIVTTD